MSAHEIQKAVYTKLRADATLTSLLAAHAYTSGSAIYDGAPQADDSGSSVAFPYVTLGDTTETEFDTDDSTGRESTLTLHVWSRYAGMKQAQDIMDRIKTVLHNQPLTVTGETVVLVLWEFSQLFEDPDGITRHAVTRFRIISEGT